MNSNKKVKRDNHNKSDKHDKKVKRDKRDKQDKRDKRDKRKKDVNHFIDTTLKELETTYVKKYIDLVHEFSDESNKTLKKYEKCIVELQQNYTDTVQDKIDSLESDSAKKELRNTKKHSLDDVIPIPNLKYIIPCLLDDTRDFVHDGEKRLRQKLLHEFESDGPSFY